MTSQFLYVGICLVVGLFIILSPAFFFFFIFVYLFAVLILHDCFVSYLSRSTENTNQKERKKEKSVG